VKRLDVAVKPPSPYLLPRSGGSDGAMRVAGGVAGRLLHVEGRPVLVRAWQPEAERVEFRAEPVDPAAIVPPRASPAPPAEPAGSRQLEIAVERMRFALGVDDDLSDFHRRFRDDPLLGPLLRRRPRFRPRRQPWPWEALAWAVVKQLIESERAARIQRRIVGRWGAHLGGRPGPVRSRFVSDSGTNLDRALRDVPDAATIAGRAPAELESTGLALRRALALRAVARLVAAGRCDLAARESDRRLLAVPEIGPWTVRCLGLHGRGDPDSLPAGDLAYVKLVGRLAGLGRRATVEEVEEFYAPYAPFRGLAGALTLAGLHRAVAQGPPLRCAAA
jgi:DNA-3-methyladenine glycosylase II